VLNVCRTICATLQLLRIDRYPMLRSTGMSRVGKAWWQEPVESRSSQCRIRTRPFSSLHRSYPVLPLVTVNISFLIAKSKRDLGTTRRGNIFDKIHTGTNRPQYTRYLQLPHPPLNQHPSYPLLLRRRLSIPHSNCLPTIPLPFLHRPPQTPPWSFPYLQL